MLAKGKFFVGFGSSTFSFYLREHRVLQVRPMTLHGTSLYHILLQKPLLLLSRCIFVVTMLCHHTVLCTKSSPEPCVGLPAVAQQASRAASETHRSALYLQDMPRSSSVLVDASVIGTDPLFNSAGTVA